MKHVIVEVGAHTGSETLNFLNDAEAQVYAFEPSWEKFKQLQLTSQEYPRLTVLPFAIDLGDNQEALFHYDDGQSTLSPPIFGTLSRNCSMVWTMRLDTFMCLYSIDRIEYLRIDAPFREEECLESLGNRFKDVERGRIRRYNSRSRVSQILLDEGFQIAADTTSSNITEPNLRFWRT